MSVKSKLDAQKRVDQIRYFQAELDIVEKEKILSLDDAQRSAVSGYHGNLIKTLSTEFDIDTGRREKQFSLGMKIASFLGAIGLAASVFFLFYQFWGGFSTATQVFILISAPLVSLAATMVVSFKEKTGYFSKLFGMVSFACFVLNLSMFGQIFNITPSPNAFLVWAIFAFLLAYASDARILLAAGIICMAAFLSAKTGTWSGCYWINFGERPENFFPAAFILFAVPFVPHNQFSGFAVIYRVFAMLLFFIPVLILSNWGAISYLNLSRSAIENIYQVAGFMFSAGAIWLGIKKSWPEVVNTGNIFFTIFLYTKFYDWWWDWMPKYLFFLVISLTAILILLIFKRLRHAGLKNMQEVSN
ncbi:MAG: DUF2157 domain-containing protein [Proteobacteria bacterium]|nr:DUF2157 domain-containing protein [Pseudomonadota bacterium]MBU1387453.1 DUF2157 domain-containing protein [Pseudomonadota bacterium]MBU1541960.1 DUF2157 domain-containing protein [Pseudomonadota bacterium]MBU2479565.1 DUF2157 domain-containing protein [Pseudomonadota bacterium]